MTEWTVEHTPLVHEECDKPYCMFCEGGLSACTVCGAFEGATTTHCPGTDMYREYGDRVYNGLIDFRAGEWRAECSRWSPAYWHTPEGLAEIEDARDRG